MSSRVAVYSSVMAAVLGIGCAHSDPPSAGSSEGSKNEVGIWWAPSLGLRSLSMIDRRLGERFADPFDVVRVASKSEPADRQVIASCGSYFTLQPKGYQPRSDVDGAALKVEGAKCQAIRALRNAKPSTRQRPFALREDSLEELPAGLAPAPSPLELEQRDAAARTGTSWRSYDSSALLSARDAFRARVTAAESITDIEIVGQADFDGDGAADTLTLTVSGGTKGSWGEIRLRLLTRASETPVLRVVKEFPL